MPQFIMGARGLPRRYYDYPPEFEMLNKVSTIGAFIITLGIIIAILTIIHAIFRGKKTGENPWGANTLLSGKSPSPPPHENFHTQPVVTSGPYEYKS